jgi:hypothetical protein
LFNLRVLILSLWYIADYRYPYPGISVTSAPDHTRFNFRIQDFHIHQTKELQEKSLCELGWMNE